MEITTYKRVFRALDLFCGGGGACLGMQQAGFEVFGIDNKRHKNYPGHFILADIHDLPVNIFDFDMIWASPPCQFASVGALCWKTRNPIKHPNLIPATREILKGHPYTVIENVPRAPMRSDIFLYGPSNGLPRIERKRIFELSFFMLTGTQWKQPRSEWKKGNMCCITKSMSSQNHFYARKKKGLPGRVPNWEAKEVMGIPAELRFTNNEIGEAVPPPYAKLIADEVMRQITK